MKDLRFAVRGALDQFVAELMLDIIFFLDILNMIRTFSFLNDLSNDKNLSKIKKRSERRSNFS